MDNIVVREAAPDEARTIVQMVRRMVADMASYGGHAPATDDSAWNKLVRDIAEELRGNFAKYLIAESTEGEPIGVAGAKLSTLGGAFEPKTTLHISIAYVLPQHRRKGIATVFLKKMLDWGRAVGADQCDLNVLSNNPAKSLYQKHGFSIFELSMVRLL
jgi:GNAT superfamily N-acetyltransferase